MTLFRIASNALNWVFLRLAILLLGIMTISCILQIVTRLLGSSLTWTEELARYCFIWVNMLGATVLVKNGGHAVIDILSKRFTGHLKTVNLLIIYLLIFFSGIVLLHQGGILTYAVRNQTSMALGIPMSIVYSAGPLCGFGLCVHTLQMASDLLFPSRTPAGGC